MEVRVASGFLVGAALWEYLTRVPGWLDMELRCWWLPREGREQLTNTRREKVRF